MLEWYLFKDFKIVDKKFIIDEQDLKFWDFRGNNVSIFCGMQMEKLVVLNDFSGCSWAFIVIKQTVEFCPLLNLSSPLGQSCQRGQDQERTQDIFVSMQMVEKRNGLNCFSETHFICQDAVPVFVPILDHPIQTLELEFFEHSVIFENGDVFTTVLARFFAESVK